jgi:hypothetical protein
MNSAFLDYYRCPESFAAFALNGRLSGDCGYFRFGPDALCYGRCSSGFRAKRPTDLLYDALADVAAKGPAVRLPFSPSEIVANLRCERFALSSKGGGKLFGPMAALRKLYYMARPFMSVSVRKHLQRIRLRDWESIPFPTWPVDPNVELIFEKLLALLLKAHSGESIPFIWFWPNGFPSCAIVTHDVEGISGRNFCSALMDLDEAHGVKSSFQIVPEGRYSVSKEFLNSIRERGFEINVHDLNHEGNLFSERELFLRCAQQINRYAKDYGAAGFRSAVLYRNVDWFGALDFSYDMSVPCVGHLEAQRGGCCSVMPFFIGKILELPVTTTQDYSLFHILNQYSTDLWKREITSIARKHGLVSFIVHPDYLLKARARDTYKALLAYLAKLRSDGKIWIPLPQEVNQWWRERSQMKLTRRGNGWEIDGPGKERARIAYANLEGDSVVYQLQPASSAAAV